MPHYLAEWLVASNGGQPVRFQKGSMYNSFLRVYLISKRNRTEQDSSTVPEDMQEVRIAVPNFYGKDASVYNYMTDKTKKAFVSMARDDFDQQILREVLSMKNCFRTRKEIVEAWMDTVGIEYNDRNFNSVMKRVQIVKARTDDRARKRAAKSKFSEQ